MEEHSLLVMDTHVENGVCVCVCVYSVYPSGVSSTLQTARLLPRLLFLLVCRVNDKLERRDINN